MGILRYLGLVFKTAVKTALDWAQFSLFLVFVVAGFVLRFSTPANQAGRIAGRVTEVLVSAETAAIVVVAIILARLVAAPYFIWRDDQDLIESLSRPLLHEVTTSVDASATSVMLLAANPERKGATIFNKSASPVFVKFGAEASPTSYKIEMAPGSYFEFPPPVYQGAVHGVWLYRNGGAQLTETT